MPRGEKEMPTEIIGRYEVGSVIGRGAMAVVYKAVDPTIGRSVALKTMRFDVHSIEKNEVLSRFRNEARAAGKLLHPNLVTIYDAGEQDGTFYIAMECVEGHTLQALLSEERFLTLDHTVDILSQICSGLDYAHANGVVHRDIKPANIMITPSGVVKIMDFGIAKAGAQLTVGGDILGTPNYISPEMVKGDPVDGRSDLFSVAIILYEMLLGERPFGAANISTIIYKIVNEPLPAELETRVHPAVAAILRKALSKHPSDRYQTGGDLVGAVKSYQALLTQPIPTTVVPGTPVLTKFAAASSGGAGAAVAPKLANVTPIPNVGLKTPTFEAPPVFGSDVPPAFLGLAEPDTADLTEIAEQSNAPTGTFTPPPPADPVSSTLRAPLKPGGPPPVFGSRQLAHSPVPPAPFPMRRVLLVGGVTLFVMAAIAVGYKGISHHAAPPAPMTVETRDPYAISQTESVKATEVTSGKDRRDSVRVVEPTASKKKTAKAETVVASAAAPVAAAPVVVTADLAIASTPAGASVQLDGESRSEQTPFTASALKPGAHTLIFTKPGYKPLTRTVDIVGGNDASVSVNLAAEVTAVSFESTPAGGTISIDDDPTGQVTPATIKVPPGTHAVSIAKPGFQEATGNVHIDQGDTQQFSVVLQPSDRDGNIHRIFGGIKDRGMIIVRTRPRGAHVTIDDNALDAVTPTRIIMHKGKAHLLIEAPGYKPYRSDVQVDKGDVIVLNAVLEPK